MNTSDSSWAFSHAQDGDEEWPKALSRKDATAYVRAVKRYGLEQRLPEIAAEVGPNLESAPEPAQCVPYTSSAYHNHTRTLPYYPCLESAPEFAQCALHLPCLHQTELHLPYHPRLQNFLKAGNRHCVVTK